MIKKQHFIQLYDPKTHERLDKLWVVPEKTLNKIYEMVKKHDKEHNTKSAII